MSEPKISVILTSYNHDKYLAKSIDSILAQTYQNFELIIVDDCSSDQSWKIILEYKKENPHIKIVHHEYNWGTGIIPSTVRDYATGDYIAIHHSDDIWEENKLEKQIAIVKENPKYAAVFTNAAAIDEKGNLYNDKDGFYFNLFSVENRTRHEWLNYFFYYGNCLCHPSILIKKSVYEEDGFFRRGLQQIPDFVKWIQLCKQHEIYVIPEKLVKFRIHNEGKNTSGMRVDTQIRSSIELNLMLMEYASINDREEFLKIFPEAGKYCTENFFISDYVLGRLCTEEKMPAYTRIFGVQLLYKALNDINVSNVLKKEFSYTDKQFEKANGKYDIFGIIPKGFEQNRSLYYDTGAGYNVKEVVTEKFTLSEKCEFLACFTVDLTGGGNLIGMRFVPAEGVMIKSTLFEVLINGTKTEYVGENAFSRDDDKDIFLTLDPIYSINIPESIRQHKIIKVSISGKIERLTDDEIMQAVILQQSNYKNLRLHCKEVQEYSDVQKRDYNDLRRYYDDLKRDYNKIESNYNDLQGYYNGLKCDYNDLQGHYDELQECCNRFKTELTAIKSTFLYKLGIKVKKMFGKG